MAKTKESTKIGTSNEKKKAARAPEASVSARTTNLVSLRKDPISHVRAEAPLPLSLKEKNVLEFLESYMRDKGVSPTYQEICQHFGFASFNSVQRYLKQLEAKGYIRLPWANQKRAITLLQSSAAVRHSLGEMDSREIDYREIGRKTSRSDKNSTVHQDESEGGVENFANVTPAILPSESLSLPLLGRVAAGAPIEAMEHDEFIEVPSSLVRHADRTYALRVQGQSMIDDGILDGDVILVQRQSAATNGEIVVAMVGEEATVKRFYVHRNSDSEAVREAAAIRGSNGERMIELRPANSTMAPMWYDPSEVQIRGVVVGLIRRFM